MSASVRSVFKNPKITGCGTCPYRSKRMFCNLAPAALEMYKAIGSHARVAKGSILFWEDEPCDRAIVLCTGRVKLHCTSKSGRNLILKIAQPGEVLGLSAIISGARYETTATTLESVQIKTICKTQFIAFLKAHSEASLHASHALSVESNRAFLDIRRLALSGSAAARLAGVLLDCEREQRCPGSSMRFTMTLTHEDLAGLAGTSRETVTRTLRRFHEEELIHISRRSIEILSPAALEDMLDSPSDDLRHRSSVVDRGGNENWSAPNFATF